MSGEGELSFWLKRQLSAFEEKFVAADTDKSGFLSLPEVAAVLRNAGFKGTDEDIQAIFKFADKNKDAKISRAEYLQALKKAPKINLKEIVLRRAFRRYDADGSGFLTRDEVVAITASEEAGLNLPAENVAEMLLALVTDTDKKISYEEFLSHFRYQQTATLLRELFTRIDKDGSGRLTKQEIVNAIKADEELAFQAANLSQLLISFTRENTDNIDYQQFARIVAAQAKK
ncbi:CALL3-like protein [Mya arenaria]|uniref:CALL3-like protein n=1 Tax=Mya arenaria TaxID=6604 RepID=A0ABY7EPW3_MYAAR|nr:calmodulin-like protein 3 [Mya arenaria]WAR10846.1 CALL3-like protein [Mya arenaria]